jgi:hypothetical protein
MTAIAFTALSVVVGVFLFAMFVMFAFFPDRYMRVYFGEAIGTPAGRNEVRAMIGGTNLGLSLLMFLGVVFPEHQAMSYAAVGIVGIAIGTTRAVFLVTLDRPHTIFNRIDAMIEPFGGAMLLGLAFLV